MELLVYEYTSTTGLDEKLVQPSILSEGFGMLKTLVADAKAAGISVTTILNGRIAGFNPTLDAEHKIPVNSKLEAERAFEKNAEKTDAILVVAPETNGILQELIEKIEQSNIISLNSSATAIAQVSDKAFLQLHTKNLGLKTPETLTINTQGNVEDSVQLIRENISYPAIIKPTRNAGCEALSIIKNQGQARKAIKEMPKHLNNRFVVQKLIQGVPVSVTLISNGTEAQPLILNEQHVMLNPPNHASNYIGGTTPFIHKQQERAYSASKKLVESIKGLRGYVGVDLILTEEEAVVIEINPRLTTSYIGIQKILKLNLLQTIVNAVMKHRLPTNLEVNGYAYFEKIKTLNPTTTALQETFKMSELITPPFPDENNDSTYAFICTKGSTPKEAKHEFTKAKRQLFRVLHSGGCTKR